MPRKGLSLPWYVCDMDLGVLHAAATRRDALLWIGRTSGGMVVARHIYMPGWYDYQIGYSAEDHSTYTIVREDRLDAYGLSDEHRQALREGAWDQG